MTCYVSRDSRHPLVQLYGLGGPGPLGEGEPHGTAAEGGAEGEQVSELAPEEELALDQVAELELDGDLQVAAQQEELRWAPPGLGPLGPLLALGEELELGWIRWKDLSCAGSRLPLQPGRVCSGGSI